MRWDERDDEVALLGSCTLLASFEQIVVIHNKRYDQYCVTDCIRSPEAFLYWRFKMPEFFFLILSAFV
jgi:hypothetical protein